MNPAQAPGLIVTADDFGLSLPVNEAVETAHRDGILTCASLMVAAPVAEDAVRRARRLPGLGVGLHLVLMDGRPMLPPRVIPDLVGPDGRLLSNPVAIGVKLFFDKQVQRQAEAEIRAQFARFAATGLPLDHVNGHHHFHQHPTVVGMLIRLAPEFGIKAVRLPLEPPGPAFRAQGDAAVIRYASWFFSAARLLRMRARLNEAGIAVNDAMFGLYDTGRMTADRLDRYLAARPAAGVSEIYCHPAVRPWIGPDALPEHYRCVEEFEAIADPARRARLLGSGVKLMPFAGLASP